jgi:hypothetical protein
MHFHHDIPNSLWLIEMYHVTSPGQGDQAVLRRQAFRDFCDH